MALGIESVEAANGFLTVVVSGSNLSESYFRSEISANVRLEVSNGYNDFTSDYVNIVPWTTDTIYIPDANFKAYLTTEFDTNGDNEISLEEAQSITNIDISASLLQVKSLVGIEYFSNLETLDCSFNRITSLDLSGNKKLTEVNVGSNRLTSLLLPTSVTAVDASNNKLTTLDVSAAKNLTTLNVANNTLGSLNVAQNKALVELNCTGNDIATLNLNNLLLLEELYCGGNDLAALNVTKNTALTALECNDNSLTALDLTKNAALVTLNCRDNQLPSIHLGSTLFTTIDCANNQLNNLNVSTFTKLKSLDCSHNNIATLDVAKCAVIETLNCSYNNIASLNVSANAQLNTLDCSNNAALAKLWVKDSAQQGAIDITKDDATNIYFNNGGLVIPDTALKAYLVNNYDDDGDGEISIAESDNITMVNCSGKGISDLTGLEACTNLVTLNCANNSITTVELPNLTQLRTLTCNNNPIKHINLDNCVALEHLNLQGTPSSAISGSAITITNYTQSESLYLSIKSTPFTSLTVKDMPTLTTLEFYGEFTDVAVTDNTTLTSLVFHSPTVNANLSGNSALESVDVSALTDLKAIDVQKCNLQSLDVTNNEALISLNCSDNAFVTLDLTQNTLLETLIGDNLALTKINLSNNAKLSKYSFTGNPELTTIRVHNNFTMDSCLFTSAGNNPSLSIFNTAGKIFYYVGQYSTTLGSAGVVFEITNGGQNGKMVSVEETLCSWSSEGIDTNAVNSDDGMANMNTIKAINPDLSKYPAFRWCADYGTDWYLPARNELKTIYNNKSTINSILSAYGYTSLDASYYWSSTEQFNSWAYTLKISDGGSYGYEKSNQYTVRAVLAF